MTKNILKYPLPFPVSLLKEFFGSLNYHLDVSPWNIRFLFGL
jgi:hypothetical protein